MGAGHLGAHLVRFRERVERPGLAPDAARPALAPEPGVPGIRFLLPETVGYVRMI